MYILQSVQYDVATDTEKKIDVATFLTYEKAKRVMDLIETTAEYEETLIIVKETE